METLALSLMIPQPDVTHPLLLIWEPAVVIPERRSTNDPSPNMSGGMLEGLTWVLRLLGRPVLGTCDKISSWD